jgi:hypothetical protein
MSHPFVCGAKRPYEILVSKRDLRASGAREIGMQAEIQQPRNETVKFAGKTPIGRRGSGQKFSWC